jgi:hypothetical protein
MGFARLVSLDEGDRAGYVARYTDTLSQLVATYAVTDWAERHFRQASIVSATCTWQVRAREWTAFLEQRLSARSIK